MKMNFKSIDRDLEKIVLSKLSSLLLEERKIKRRSVRTLARKVKARRKDIKKWEAGKACPPGYIMFAIGKHYGKVALSRLADLDFEFQMLKHKLKAKKEVQLTIAA